MFESRWRSTGRVEGIPGIGDDAWGWIALWAGAATVAGLAAATVEPIVDLGAGAVVLAGAGAASAVALAVAASTRLGAPALSAWRRAKPPRGVAHPPPDGDPFLREFATALAAQLARLDDKLSAAMSSGAVPGGVGTGPGADPERDTLARAVERLKRGQQTFFARVEARAEALNESVLRRVAGLDEEAARLGRAVAEGDTRLRDFEGQVLDILRARDDDTILRRLDSEASDLFDKLFYVDGRDHDTAEAWRADHAEWRSRIKGFWDIVRGYRTGVDQPFAVTEADIDHAGGVPDTALFGTEDMRRRFKMLVLVNERHVKFREDAFLFNAKKGSVPGPGVRPPPRARRSLLAAG